eukprot:523722-Lingulodinium_polyedra.AAC.1
MGEASAGRAAAALARPPPRSCPSCSRPWLMAWRSRTLSLRRTPSAVPASVGDVREKTTGPPASQRGG